jgi:hypothetical protein
MVLVRLLVSSYMPDSYICLRYLALRHFAPHGAAVGGVPIHSITNVPSHIKQDQRINCFTNFRAYAREPMGQRLVAYAECISPLEFTSVSDGTQQDRFICSWVFLYADVNLDSSGCSAVVHRLPWVVAPQLIWCLKQIDPQRYGRLNEAATATRGRPPLAMMLAISLGLLLATLYLTLHPKGSQPAYHQWHCLPKRQFGHPD